MEEIKSHFLNYLLGRAPTTTLDNFHS